MMLVLLLIRGYADPYVDYIAKYVGRPTAISCGSAVLVILLVAALVSRTNRSSESSTRHTE